MPADDGIGNPRSCGFSVSGEGCFAEPWCGPLFSQMRNSPGGKREGPQECGKEAAALSCRRLYGNGNRRRDCSFRQSLRCGFPPGRGCFRTVQRYRRSAGKGRRGQVRGRILLKKNAEGVAAFGVTEKRGRMKTSVRGTVSCRLDSFPYRLRRVEVFFPFPETGVRASECMRRYRRA